MINIAICEDNEVDKSLLELYIREVMEKQLEKDLIDGYTLYKYSSGNEMIETLEKYKYHLVFLDMYMGDILGIEVAKKLREIDGQTIIIFVTSSTDFAVEGYTVRAYHYLVKPIMGLQVVEVINSAVSHILEKEDRYVLIPTLDGLTKVKLQDIYYIECVARKTLVIMRNSTFTCTYNINTLEEKLNHLGFIRCHRSFIINLKYIKTLKAGTVIMENEEEVLLSKYRQKEVRARLTEFLGGQL